VTLNQSLLYHAGIEKEVVLVGNIDHLEAWDRGVPVVGQGTGCILRRWR
jgi:hypothetical protein